MLAATLRPHPHPPRRPLRRQPHVHQLPHQRARLLHPARNLQLAAFQLNSRRNALRHGLTAKHLTLDRESDDRFIQILAALEAHLQPQNELENELVEVIACARWRTMRTWSHEKAVLDTAVSDARRASTDPNLRAAECGGIAHRNRKPEPPLPSL